MSIYKFGCSIQLIVLCLYAGPITTTEIDVLCQKCDLRSTSSYVNQYCRENNSTGRLMMSHSCCLNRTHTPDIIGIDLSNCSLTSVEGYFTNFTNLNVILLQHNSDLKIKTDDFRGLFDLKYLSIPKGLQCPGGNESWNTTKLTADAVLCKDEVNMCDIVSCPNSNSYCIMTEPGGTQCLCKEGFYGYKCLRQGHFPTVVYTVVLCSLTIIIAGYLWCIQRRKVKKHYS